MDRYVEGGDGFVANHQLRVGGDGAGDADSLALSARKLEGVAIGGSCRQADDIRRLQKRFAAVLARAIRQPDCVGELMLGLGTKLFSQDHDWREIAESVAHQSPAYDPYKRLVLVKYLEYLGARHRVLASLYVVNPPPAGTATAGRAARACPPSADGARVAALQATAIFEAPTTAVPAGGFLALARGQPTRVELDDGRELVMRLGAEEFALIRTHSLVGYDIVKETELPAAVTDIVLHHHERLDGSGYPDGLRGDAILRETRVLAVADVVEAMSSHRPYRPALGIEAALAEIRRGSGTLFDTEVVEACQQVILELGFDWTHPERKGR